MKQTNLILLSLIFILAFLIRILPYWMNAVKDGQIYYADPDSCYHLRRIELSANHFPNLLIMDNFAGPEGNNYIIWSPLYDWVLSLLWYLLSLIGFTKNYILFIIAFINPLLALVCSYFIYKLAKEIIFSEFYALISAILFLFFPRNIIYSSFANIDHHMAEIFSMVFLFYQFLKFWQDTTQRNIIKLAIAISLSSLIWTGGYFFTFCILIFSFIEVKGIEIKKLLYLNKTLFLAFFIILPFSFWYIFYGVPLIKMDAFSLFHSLINLIFSFFIFLYIKIRDIKKREISLKEKLFFNFTFLSGALAFFICLPEVIKGIEYIFKKNPKFMSFVSESESLFKSRGQWTYEVIFLYLSYFIILLPLFYIFLIKNKQKLSERGFIFLLIGIPIFFFLAILQKKFSFHFSIFFSLLIGLNLNLLWEFLNKRIGKLSILLLILLIIIMYYPCRSILKFGNDYLYSEIYSLMPAFEWLKKNSDPLLNDFNNKQAQSYYVLSEWNLGHFIQFYAERAVVADNFGKNEHMKIIADVFLTYSEKEALELLKKYKIKYILVRDFRSTLFWLPLIKGELPEDYFRSYVEGDKLYVSPVGGLTIGFRLCENPTSLLKNKNPFSNHIKLIKEWEDKHREQFRDGAKGNVRLYEIDLQSIAVYRRE